MEYSNVNTGIVKELNLQLIRKAFIKLFNATKSQIARETQLSSPTVNKLVDELVSKGEIIDTNTDILSGGRSAKLYSFNTDFALSLCIHFEKTKMWYEVVNLIFEPIDKGSIEIRDFQHLICIENLIENLLTKFQNIKSVAIGVPAGVKDGKLFFIPDYVNLSGFNLEEHIKTKFNIPAIVENDVNAAILGYNSHMENFNNENIGAIYLGSNGPGCGILVNGNLVRGFSGFAGEVGFIKVSDKTFQDLIMENIYSEGDFASIILAICAIINPKKIVLFSYELKIPNIEKILDLLKKMMPESAIPEIIEENRWHFYYVEGLKRLAQELFEKGYTLVR